MPPPQALQQSECSLQAPHPQQLLPAHEPGRGAPDWAADALGASLSPFLEAMIPAQGTATSRALC